MFEWLNEAKRRQNMIWDEVQSLSTSTKRDEE